jgi:hypothetical protein
MWVLFAHVSCVMRGFAGCDERLVDLEGSGDCVSVSLEVADDLVDIAAFEGPCKGAQTYKTHCPTPPARFQLLL